MKKFRMRLWLVKRLLDSLINGCLDEFPEFDSISEGVAHLHSAIETDGAGKRKAVDRTDPTNPTRDLPDPELVNRMRLIIKHGDCIIAGKKTGITGNDFCVGCFDIVSGNCKNKRPDYWDCNKEGESARRWLREHGIKEE